MNYSKRQLAAPRQTQSSISAAAAVSGKILLLTLRKVWDTNEQAATAASWLVGWKPETGSQHTSKEKPKSFAVYLLPKREKWGDYVEVGIGFGWDLDINTEWQNFGLWRTAPSRLLAPRLIDFRISPGTGQGIKPIPGDSFLMRSGWHYLKSKLWIDWCVTVSFQFLVVGPEKAVGPECLVVLSKACAGTFSCCMNRLINIRLNIQARRYYCDLALSFCPLIWFSWSLEN